MRIIKALTIVALLSVPVTDSWSQGFEFGGKVGLPISNIRLTDMPSQHINSDKPEIWMHFFESKIGFNISAFGQYSINSKVDIRIEPGYIVKGANFSASESKLSLHYLNLPILARFNVSNRVGILAGPEFSMLLKASLDFDGDNIDMKDFYDDANELSLNIGVEYLATERFGFGFRYNHGLTKVSKTVWTDDEGEIDGICKETNHYVLLYSVLSL